MTPLPTPDPAEITAPPEAKGVVQIATEDLAQRRSLPLEEIRLLSVEAMEWSDASLGCPQPGMMYAQIITPGYRMVLEADGEAHTYHTDHDRIVVLCEEEKNSSTTPSRGLDTMLKDGGPNQPRDNDVVITPPTNRK